MNSQETTPVGFFLGPALKQPCILGARADNSVRFSSREMFPQKSLLRNLFSLTYNEYPKTLLRLMATCHCCCYSFGHNSGKVEGSGFRVQGSRFRVQGFRCMCAKLDLGADLRFF
jgi:hypothetical protein